MDFGGIRELVNHVGSDILGLAAGTLGHKGNPHLVHIANPAGPACGSCSSDADVERIPAGIQIDGSGEMVPTLLLRRLKLPQLKPVRPVIAVIQTEVLACCDLFTINGGVDRCC